MGVPADVDVVQAEAAQWTDVVELFGTRGDPSWCWCQYFVTRGAGYTQDTDRNREALRATVQAGGVRPAGLLAYRDGVPLGWLQLGPRECFPRVTANVAASRVVEGLPGESVWRTTCFVVKVGHRRGGVATALLDAGIRFAREHGASGLEGHPVDVAARGGRSGGAILYHGALSTFLAAGFTEVGRTTPTRPVVRLGL